jgi:hypothetical protein
LVADILHEHQESIGWRKVHEDGNLYGQGHIAAIADLQVKFADRFEQDNPRFKREKFYNWVNNGRKG